MTLRSRLGLRSKRSKEQSQRNELSRSQFPDESFLASELPTAIPAAPQMVHPTIYQSQFGRDSRRDMDRLISPSYHTGDSAIFETTHPSASYHETYGHPNGHDTRAITTGSMLASRHSPLTRESPSIGSALLTSSAAVSRHCYDLTGTNGPSHTLHTPSPTSSQVEESSYHYSFVNNTTTDNSQSFYGSEKELNRKAQWKDNKVDKSSTAVKFIYGNTAISVPQIVPPKHVEHRVDPNPTLVWSMPSLI